MYGGSVTKAFDGKAGAWRNFSCGGKKDNWIRQAAGNALDRMGLD
jgi:hypothetical protein